MFPEARRDDLIIRELPDETLVYETRRHQAHCLNRTAALVWRHCDGLKSIQDLANILHQELKVPADGALVHATLDQLDQAGLLAKGASLPAEAQVRSRRSVLVKLGIGLALLPVVMSVTAPRAMAQSSNIPGPPGPPGATGATGPQGPPGPPGPAGQQPL